MQGYIFDFHDRWALGRPSPPGERLMERGGNQFVAGLLTGALVGASLAMVFSPVSGGDVRDILRAKADDATTRAKDALDTGSGNP